MAGSMDMTGSTDISHSMNSLLLERKNIMATSLFEWFKKSRNNKIVAVGVVLCLCILVVILIFEVSGGKNLSVSSECGASAVCVDGTCRNLCDSACGNNSNCKVVLNTAVCACKDRHWGDPLTGCHPITGNCAYNKDCPNDMVCVERTCKNPCENRSCGVNAVCRLSHNAVYCNCTAGYSGDPYTECCLNDEGNKFVWSSSEQGWSPGCAVVAGREMNGTTLYAGRAHHEEDLLPAVVRADNWATVSYFGKEHVIGKFEVLESKHIQWKESWHGLVEPNAMPIGYTKENETLYMGRVMHKGSVIPCKVHPSHVRCYFTYDGSEIGVTEDYEIMLLI